MAWAASRAPFEAAPPTAQGYNPTWENTPCSFAEIRKNAQRSHFSLAPAPAPQGISPPPQRALPPVLNAAAGAFARNPRIIGGRIVGIVNQVPQPALLPGPDVGLRRPQQPVVKTRVAASHQAEPQEQAQNRASFVSANVFANQNQGNVITERSTTRRIAPPGGVSVIQLGNAAPQLQPRKRIEQVTLSQQQQSNSRQVPLSPIKVRGTGWRWRPTDSAAPGRAGQQRQQQREECPFAVGGGFDVDIDAAAAVRHPGSPRPAESNPHVGRFDKGRNHSNIELGYLPHGVTPVPAKDSLATAAALACPMVEKQTDDAATEADIEGDLEAELEAELAKEEAYEEMLEAELLEGTIAEARAQAGHVVASDGPACAEQIAETAMPATQRQRCGRSRVRAKRKMRNARRSSADRALLGIARVDELMAEIDELERMHLAKQAREGQAAEDNENKAKKNENGPEAPSDGVVVGEKQEHGTREESIARQKDVNTNAAPSAVAQAIPGLPGIVAHVYTQHPGVTGDDAGAASTTVAQNRIPVPPRGGGPRRGGGRRARARNSVRPAVGPASQHQSRHRAIQAKHAQHPGGRDGRSGGRFLEARAQHRARQEAARRRAAAGPIVAVQGRGKYDVSKSSAKRFNPDHACVHMG